MGVQKRNRRNGNVTGNNAAIKLFDFSGRERVHCCMRDVSPHPANNLNKTFGGGHYFLITARLRVDYLSYSECGCLPIIKVHCFAKAVSAKLESLKHVGEAAAVCGCYVREGVAI